jgi:hypothetical protein
MSPLSRSRRRSYVIWLAVYSSLVTPNRSSTRVSQVAIVETVDEVLKQSQRQKQRHHSGLAELQCRRFLTVLGDGRLHHALDAVAAQATVVR